MSINAYVGLQGSGKSFEVVSSVIIDALEQGRRVVTNVAGINEDRIHEYLVSKRKADADTLGQIVHVTNDRIMQPQFFPDEEEPELESVVQGGDLVAIDEAWRFWGVDNGKLSHEHMQFFRMHRHYVNPKTGATCDVVLMTQDITGLHRSVRNVIEFTFRMYKLKSLGLSKRYRVEIYEGWKLNTKTRIDDRQKKYDPEIFPLYQSYTGGQGMEKAIDKRQNILANRTLWLYAGGVVVMMSIGGWGAWRFFHPADAANEHVEAGKVRSGTVSATSMPAAAAPARAAFSEGWRVVGTFETEESRWVVVADEAGRLRVESPSMFNGEGAAIVGQIDGETAARWSGSKARQVAAGGAR
ncbi:zonular occludens toxin domain-containing protein [Vogesella sp. DC21W]|uniref:Zonular occludens toxin domain-containing protein n=1 Tax=Vogesella aquatica TaxID=2984206 RepID=A0ABT5IXL0_9NEIS|nr:zonular occludens toxin domain-containing protein [Vogesella aquatica]MDC7717307.1 zonular occludens toxin domain-containing protein [Vogesella aquatica]